MVYRAADGAGAGLAMVKTVQQVDALDVPALEVVIVMTIVLARLAVRLLDDRVIEYRAGIITTVLLHKRLDREPKLLAPRDPSRKMAGDLVVEDVTVQQ
ncbi:hypothetical protein MNBD_BACTEROID03-249 [hydrothermal vent metagenome]|uniref:Uncharacterized protein n=1 Tax=hydrothermal vent metagenome TaxID=652676 RepID=A0A3B0SXU1_9ZZZZ